ncbi:STAS domain-containing protein [Colwellia sp. MEBiC06753]
MSALSIQITDNNASLVGDLNSTSISALKKQAHKALLTSDAMSISLDQVKDVDTAGLAWLLYLIEQANLCKCRLTFADLPEDLLNLAKLSAVDEFLSSPSY